MVERCPVCAKRHETDKTSHFGTVIKFCSEVPENTFISLRTALDGAVQAELKKSGFENYLLPNLSKYPPRQIIKAVKWAREVLGKR